MELKGVYMEAVFGTHIYLTEIKTDIFLYSTYEMQYSAKIIYIHSEFCFWIINLKASVKNSKVIT